MPHLYVTYCCSIYVAKPRYIVFPSFYPHPQWVRFRRNSTKLQHASEISIELVPLINGTFRFPAKSGRSSDSNEHEREAREKFYQDRTRDRLLSIARMLEDLAHTSGLDSDSLDYRAKKNTRR